MRYKVKEILQRITKKDNETMGENHVFLMVRDLTQEIKHLTNEFQKEKIEKEMEENYQISITIAMLK